MNDDQIIILLSDFKDKTRKDSYRYTLFAGLILLYLLVMVLIIVKHQSVTLLDGIGFIFLLALYHLILYDRDVKYLQYKRIQKFIKQIKRRNIKNNENSKN